MYSKYLRTYGMYVCITMYLYYVYYVYVHGQAICATYCLYNVCMVLMYIDSMYCTHTGCIVYCSYVADMFGSLSFIEKLVLLQVCDALNRHDTTIYSVLGETVSLHSPYKESPHTDIWGEYKGMKFVANFVYAITEQDVEELIQEKRNSRSDRGFLLCSKKTISIFLGARLRQEDCEFVRVKILPWKIGSQEERTFMEAFNSHFPVSVCSLFCVLFLVIVCETLMSSLHHFRKVL